MRRSVDTIDVIDTSTVFEQIATTRSKWKTQRRGKVIISEQVVMIDPPGPGRPPTERNRADSEPLAV